VAEVTGRAVGVGARKKGRCSGELDVLWGLRRVVIGWRGDGLHGAALVDRRWYGVVHDGRVSDSAGAGGDGAATLAAVAPMRKLVVVETASQLSLFQVSGNVFVGHLLETSLEKINFLKCCVSYEQKHRAEHIIVPRPRSMLCRRQWMPAFCSFARQNRGG
jgi:hypothetical protein